MNFFAFDPRKLALILFVVIIPLITLNMMEEPGETPWYIKPVNFVGGYSQMAYSVFSNSIRSTVSLYGNLIDVKS